MGLNNFCSCSDGPDETPPVTPANTVPRVTTAGITDISDETALCGGDITSDGGESVTERGVCWSLVPTPTTADYTTSDGTGTGIFTSDITGLENGTTYFVRAYATNSEGTGYGETQTFITTITDIDGNRYQTVKIVNQVWMAENLKVTHYRNGNDIPNVTGDAVWAGLYTGAYCYYDNDPANADDYGCLYNWFAVEDERNIAPEGWHVPSDAEWKELEMSLGMSEAEADDSGQRGTGEGAKLKKVGWWPDPATDESGFSALPGGYRIREGDFNNLSRNAYFWTSTHYYLEIGTTAWDRSLFTLVPTIGRIWSRKENGCSVRCAKD